MKGLLFSKVFLDQILSGNKTNDTRMHPCKVRGPIALVEKESRMIRGTANLTGNEKISYQEFVRWHQDAIESEVPMSAMPFNTVCWSYILEDVREFPVPLDSGDKDSHMWIDLPEDISKSLAD